MNLLNANNPQQPLANITLRFKSEEGKSLLNIDIVSLHGEERRFNQIFKIQSADLLIPGNLANRINAVIPINNIVEILVESDVTPLSTFIQMEMAIAEPPTPDKFFRGWNGVKVSMSNSVLDLWDKCGSPNPWKLDTETVDKYRDELKKAQLAELEAEAKRRKIQLS